MCSILIKINLQDSLTAEDFNYSHGLAVNKNNYTLTFSGHQSIHGPGAGGGAGAGQSDTISHAHHTGSLPNSKPTQ